MSPKDFSFAEAWTLLTESGWLTILPDDAQEKLRTRLRARFEPFVNPFTKQRVPGRERLPPERIAGALATVEYDGEYLDGDRTYATLVGEFASGSHGHFQPVEICDLDGEGPPGVAFQLGGRPYELRETEKKNSSDWVDPAVVHGINEALGQAGAPGRFFPLPQLDQMCLFAFTSAEAFSSVLASGLLGSPPSAEDDSG